MASNKKAAVARENMRRVTELADEARQNIHMELSLEEYALSRGRTPEDYVSSRISAHGVSVPPLFPSLHKKIAYIEMDQKRRNRGYEAVVDARLETWGGGGRPSTARLVAEISGLGVKLKENF